MPAKEILAISNELKNSESAYAIVKEKISEYLMTWIETARCLIHHLTIQIN